MLGCEIICFGDLKPGRTVRVYDDEGDLLLDAVDVALLLLKSKSEEYASLKIRTTFDKANLDELLVQRKNNRYYKRKAVTYKNALLLITCLEGSALKRDEFTRIVTHHFPNVATPQPQPQVNPTPQPQPPQPQPPQPQPPQPQVNPTPQPQPPQPQVNPTPQQPQVNPTPQQPQVNPTPQTQTPVATGSRSSYPAPIGPSPMKRHKSAPIEGFSYKDVVEHAKAKAEATKIQSEAEAAAIKVKGDAENIVKKGALELKEIELNLWEREFKLKSQQP